MVMKKSFCVAIDGPSSSGKSTVAREVAKELGFFHIDSGAMYRALAWWMGEKNGTLKQFFYRVHDGSHFVNGHDVSLAIRAPAISQRASEIAVVPEVRKKINALQREIAKGKEVVIEGRDIGSVVFPKAEVKIFLTADTEERAKRRFRELREKGIETTMEEVHREMLFRDERDLTRKDAPLIQAKGAFVIDTTTLSIQEVIDEIVDLVRAKKGPSFLYRLARGLMYCFLRGLYRLEIRGLENYPRGALIIAPNHASYLDPPAVGSSCPGEVHGLAHVYLFKNKFLGWIFPKINVHPVASGGGDLGVLKETIGLLKERKQVIIFPEGSRSKDNRIIPLKRGVAMLASATRCKVIPVGIRGAYEIWPRWKKWPKLFGKIILTFGQPLDWKDYEARGMSKKEQQEWFTKDLEEALKALGGKDGVD